MPSEWFNVRAQFPGGIEWIILLIIIALLLLFGPSKIPELARSIGRAMGEVKRGKMEVEREIQKAVADEPAKTSLEQGRLLMAAKQLGIDVEGRTESEIKFEMKKKIDTADKSVVVRAAKTYGLSVEGVGQDQIKSDFRKALGG